MEEITRYVTEIGVTPAVAKGVIALAGLLLAWLATRLARRYVAKRIRETETRYRTQKMVSMGGYILAILAVSLVYSEKLGGLTVALGLAGAGVAFALQEVIVSVAGWAAVSAGGFYKSGDRVQLGGIQGDVIDIGMLRTTLMETGQWIGGDQYNGRIVRVANSFVFKEPVFNYSGDFPFLWDEIRVPVKHGSDRRVVREIMKSVLDEVVGEYSGSAQETWSKMVDKYLVEDARVEPSITMTADESRLEFTMRFVVDYKKRRSTRDRIYERLLEEFEKRSGDVTLPTATLAIVESPQLDVSIRKGMLPA